MQLRATEAFSDWFRRLRDGRARERISQRLTRLQFGLFGDAKTVGPGVSELRIDYGPGYRIYFARRGDSIVLLLYGGDKSSQRRDIDKARLLLAEWEDDDGVENLSL